MMVRNCEMILVFLVIWMAVDAQVSRVGQVGPVGRPRRPIIAQKTFAKGDTFSNCCPVTQCASCDRRNPFISKYRTFDGTCNNYARPTWGAINTPLKRLIPADYEDGKDTPRGFPKEPLFIQTLPPPNSISEGLFGVELVNTGSDQQLSVLFMTFGQFLDHDMVATPHARCTIQNNPGGGIYGARFRAGPRGRGIPPPCGSRNSFDYPCFPIRFTKDSKECTPFGRSQPVCQNVERKEHRATRQQANTLTAFIDGSQIYGETMKKQQSLRRFHEIALGTMKLTKRNLPIAAEKNDITCNTGGGCSLAGDDRADENIALNAMHTVWVREHNRIAKELKRYNPGWQEEKIFQVARKINIAQLQHIVYNEFIPQITKLPSWFSYNTNVDPSIANAFSTAAYRFGHGLIPNFFAQLNKNYHQVRPQLKLQDVFHNRQPTNDFGIEPIMYGLLARQCNNIDTSFSDSISRTLFVAPGKSEHMDLTAFNIQRGRDHGIPTYGKWRKHCGLSVPNDWSDLDAIMFPGAGRKFQSVYTSPTFKNLKPKDIDLFVAGIAEKHVGNLQVGPTFACIMKDQFQRLRVGDRFYYENPGQFTPAQLQAIKKVTMSSILCENLDGIKTIQLKAFKSIPNKSRFRCGAIPRLNLKKWAPRGPPSRRNPIGPPGKRGARGRSGPQ